MQHFRAASVFRRRLCHGAGWSAIALATAWPLAAAMPQQPQDLTFQVYRFWRSPDITMVEAFAGVPWRALTFTHANRMATARFEASLEVRDSTGMVLARQSWRDSVTTPELTLPSMQRASSIEHATLNLKPGRYTLVMRIEDAGSGQAVASVDTVEAFASEPRHSDLVLAARMYTLAPDSAVPQGALRRGDLVVLPNLEGAITQSSPQLDLFAELYNSAARPETANAVVRISNGSGFRHETPPRLRIIAPGTGLEALSTNLAGLPPGDYSLNLEWNSGGGRSVAASIVHMLPPGAGALAVAAPQIYEGMSASQLDTIFAPLSLLASDAERAAFTSAPDVDAKRAVLRRFWESHARAAGETVPEFTREVEERLTHVERNYSASRQGPHVHGWESDRGRIYMLMGAPADKMVSQQQGGSQTRPWEAWKYAHGRGDMYLFVDRFGFGRYDLVYTTNPHITSDPAWQSYLGREDLQRLQAF